MQFSFDRQLTRLCFAFWLLGYSPHLTAATPGVLTNTLRIQQLTSEQARERREVKLHGVVTYSHEPWRLLFVEDETGGIYCEAPVSLRFPAVGTEVELDGRTGPGNYLPYVELTALRELAPGTMPPGRVVSGSQLWDGRYDADMVRVISHVINARWDPAPTSLLTLRIANPLGATRVVIADWKGGMPQDILGAEVEIRGVFAPQANAQRIIESVTLFGSGLSSLRVITPPSEVAKRTPRTALTEFRSAEAPKGRSIYRVGGVVTLRESDQAYIWESGIGVCILMSAATQISEGDRIEALVVRELNSPEKRCELLTILSVKPGPREPAIRVTADQLPDWTRYGQVVEVDGLFLHRIANRDRELLVMRSSHTSYEVQLRFPADDLLPKLIAGSTIRATGVLRLQPTKGSSQPVARILVTQPERIRILTAPPWPMERTLSIVVILLLCLVGGLIALGIAHQRLRLSNQRLVQTESEVQLLNTDLERRIRSRTQDLEFLNDKLRHEVTDRQTAQNALADRETRLRDAQRIASLGSFHWDALTNKVSWSEELFAIYGQDPQLFSATYEAYVGQIHPNDRSQVVERIQAAFQACNRFAHDYRIIRPDGEIRWVSALGCTLLDAAGKPIAMTGTCQDITERKREASLRQEQSEILEMIARGTPLRLTLDRLIHSIESHGQGMLCSILLLDEDGKHLRHGAAPSLPDAYNSQIDGYAIGPCAGSCGTAAFRREPVIVTDIANDPFWSDVRDLALANGLRACWSTPILDGRDRVLGTFAIYYRNPGAPPPEHQRLVEVATNSAAISILKDRAERTQNLLEAELRQSQKMEAIGTLAGGIAHDFNNILGSIMGYASLAKMDVHTPGALTDHIDQLLQSSHRARDLIRHMLTFSRRDERKREVIELKPVLDESLQMLRAALPPHIDIESRIRGASLCTVGNATQLQQVIMNLVTNAGQAIGQERGRILIELCRFSAQDRQTFNLAQLPDKPLLRLSVSDDGPGIPDEIQDRIFEPFFTTKQPGQGSGLGLAVVHGIVQAHEGIILLRPHSGRGATFDVFLPASSAPQPSLVPGPPAEAERKGAERILLIDDEPSLLRVGENLLRRLGYQVTACEDPQRALALLDERPGEFDIVITDQSMPGLTGIDLARRVREKYPRLPILLCTGHGAAVDATKAQQCGIRIILDKPVELEDLHRAIRVTLDTTQSTIRQSSATAPARRL